MSSRRVIPLISPGCFRLYREDVRQEEVKPMEVQQQENTLTTFAWAAGAIVLVGALAFFMAG